MKRELGVGRLFIRIGAKDVDTVEIIIGMSHVFDLCKVGDYFLYPLFNLHSR